MATFNDNTIVAGPTIERRNVSEGAVFATDAPAGGQYVIPGSREPGQPVVERTFGTISPDYEGQIYFQRIGTQSSYIYQMSVVVDIDGTLTWVPADLTIKFNSFTGRLFDPMRSAS